MLTIRKADGVIEYVKTPEEVRREKLFEFIESLLKNMAEQGDKKAQAILKEIHDYETWFKETVRT